VKPLGFYFLIFLCAVFAGLTGLETYLYQNWEKALAEQKTFQIRESNAAQLDHFTEQLLRRTVAESFRDPALADMLKKQGIKVVVTSSGVAPATPSPFNAPAAPLLPTTNAVPLPPTGD
jgi:hypothetical protein